MHIKTKFCHGLGDCSQYLRLLELYRKRGHTIEVETDENKKQLFTMADYPLGVNCTKHSWIYWDNFNGQICHDDFVCNKTARNINKAPLPNIGNDRELWDELCSTQVILKVPQDAIDLACKWVEDLPRPIILYHQVGTNWKQRKSIPNNVTNDFYKLALREGYSLVLLDWDRRIAPINHGAVRTLDRDFGRIDLYKTAGLFSVADLMIGVDSGPYHFADFFPMPQLYLGHDLRADAVCLPRKQSAMLAMGNGQDTDVTISRRKRWSLIEYTGNMPSGEVIFKHAKRLLHPRYPVAAGRDCLLQHLIFDKANIQKTGLSDVANRGIVFDFLCSKITPVPGARIVSSGCVRSREDYGAGNSDMIFGLLADGCQAKFTSVDNNQGHINFAKNYTKCLPIEFANSDSVAYLNNLKDEVNLFYLDSWDSDTPGHEQHGLREAQAALPHLAQDGLIAFDDTIFCDGAWKGKGALAVPWLKRQGLKVWMAGYGVVLHR